MTTKAEAEVLRDREEACDAIRSSVLRLVQSQADAVTELHVERNLADDRKRIVSWFDSVTGSWNMHDFRKFVFQSAEVSAAPDDIKALNPPVFPEKK